MQLRPEFTNNRRRQAVELLQPALFRVDANIKALQKHLAGKDASRQLHETQLKAATDRLARIQKCIENTEANIRENASRHKKSRRLARIAAKAAKGA